MPIRAQCYFRVIYYDSDSHTCNISSVISDDTSVTMRTCELQKAGRNVNISTTEVQTDIGKVQRIEDLLLRIPAGYRYDETLSW